MASLYKRRGSGYWWLKRRTRAGRVIRQSTKLRVDSVSDTRKAQALAHRHTADELTRSSADPGGPWAGWVDKFLSTRYADSPRTLLRYQLAWRNLQRFLRRADVPRPGALTYNHCVEYLEWRKTPDARWGNYAAGHNTALVELRVLGVIQAEAVRRGFASHNPCVKLGVRRQKPEEKPEIHSDHLSLILRELEREPEWMRVCFTIGLHTGLRLRETNLRLGAVDLERRTAMIEHPKGGANRAFSIPFDEALAPLLQRLKRERGEGSAFEWPKNLPSKEWFNFFGRLSREHGLPHYCFHCLRVSFITRGARAGVPEAVMMKLVNHASNSIHRIYQRLSLDDVRRFLLQLHPQLSPEPSETETGSGDIPPGLTRPGAGTVPGLPAATSCEQPSEVPHRSAIAEQAEAAGE